MKKNNLFKAVGIVLLTYVLLSWIVPIVYSVAGIKPVDGEAISTQVGLISIINVVLETFSGFGGVVLFVLLVGAFYGVLKATGAYDKVLEFLLAKVKSGQKIAQYAEMFDKATKIFRETEALNLDKKQAIVDIMVGVTKI